MKDWLQLYANGGYFGKESVPEVMQGGGKTNWSNEVTDFGSRMLHGLQTFGGSYIGDFIQGISPKAAETVGKYTAGMIAPTPKEYLESNRDSWNNRVSNTANAMSMTLAGELVGPLLGAGTKKLAPIVKKAEPLIEKIIPKRSWNLDNAIKNPEFLEWLKSNGISDPKTLSPESVRGLVADFNPTHSNQIALHRPSQFPPQFNSRREFENWWDKYESNVDPDVKKEVIINSIGRDYETRLRGAPEFEKLPVFNKFYNAYRARTNNFLGWQPRQRTNFPSLNTPTVPDEPLNISYFSKSELINNAKDPLLKDKLAKMSEQEFKHTVVKPSGEVVPYGRTQKFENKIPLTEEEYAEEFNRNIHVLNEIIEKNNKSGVPYEVVKLNPYGGLDFKSSEGISSFSTSINPGKWRGVVEDVPNIHYFREQIPGLEMTNTSWGVFGDGVARRGSKTYESINEYLKLMDLGRVKPGFNSQTAYSNGAWTNFINQGKAVGYLGDRNTVYGVMKALPPIALGMSQIEKKQQGGKTNWLEDFKEAMYVGWKRMVGPGKGKVGFESVDMDDLLPRQGYKESTFLDKNVKGKNKAGAIGIAQIKQSTLKDYPELKGFNLRDPEQGVQAQKVIMDDLMSASFIDKPYQPDSITAAKGLGAYNWGRGSLSNYLNSQKKKGVDIYNTWDWLEGLPKETRDYINQVLRGKDPKFEKNFKSVKDHPYMKFYK